MPNTVLQNVSEKKKNFFLLELYVTGWKYILPMEAVHISNVLILNGKEGFREGEKLRVWH